MCEPCHNNYNWGVMPLHDCHGIDCPLGMAHPAPHNDPKKGGVFPLGCGICRSEKLEKIKQLQETTANQVNLNENKPKAWIYNGQAQIDRPDFEFDIPDFIALADELQDIEDERIRKLPIFYLPPAQLAKKLRALKRKTRREEQKIQPSSNLD